MGYRISRVYTRTGDTGTTGLADGSRIAKDSARIEAIGAVDELNSALGVLLAEELPAQIRECVAGVQHDLFDLGGELSRPGHALLADSHVANLERALDAFNSALPPLEEFVLPAGSRAAGLAHLARAICRRAERRVVRLAREEEAPPVALRYLNRLSDLLFVLARALNRHAGRADEPWRPGRNR
jgi:cob(I)alamin adenosyltransferase